MNLDSITPNFAGSYDVLVVGATPAGVACALRAAREGVSVLLAEASSHVGGMWVCGVQVFDTRYAGHRCPVLSEFVARIESYYRAPAQPPLFQSDLAPGFLWQHGSG